MPSVFRLEACSLLFINVISPTPHLFRQARMCTHSCFKMMPLRWSRPGPFHHWTPFHARFLFPLSKHSAVSIHQASFHVFQFILHFCDQCFSSLTLSADLVLVACIHNDQPIKPKFPLTVFVATKSTYRFFFKSQRCTMHNVFRVVNLNSNLGDMALLAEPLLQLCFSLCLKALSFSDRLSHLYQVSHSGLNLVQEVP